MSHQLWFKYISLLNRMDKKSLSQGGQLHQTSTIMSSSWRKKNWREFQHFSFSRCMHSLIWMRDACTRDKNLCREYSTWMATTKISDTGRNRAKALTEICSQWKGRCILMWWSPPAVSSLSSSSSAGAKNIHHLFRNRVSLWWASMSPREVEKMVHSRKRGGS